MDQGIPSAVTDEFIRTAFERCPSGLIVVDRSGKITVVNREVERLFGYDRGELVGEPIEILVPEASATMHTGLRTDYAHSPTERRMGAGRELSARHKEGHEIPVEIGLSPIHTQEGVFILGTIVDVRERRELESRLRQTQKLEAIGNLASGIAHDFNNILLGVMGYVELAREASRSLPNVVADLDTVLNTARRGRDLVNRILYFTRKSEPSRAPIAFEAPVREAIQLLRATLPSNVEIRAGVDAGVPAVVADSNELHQITMNLATNAAYAMKAHGGVLEVWVNPVTVDESFTALHPGTRPGLFVRLQVSDTGVGIPADRLTRIFEPFYTTKPAGEGTGLGLSVIGQIVHSLGGAIEVTSSVGVGTRFDVYVPAAPTTRVPAAARPSEPQAKRILLVEDEPALALLGQRVLQSLGFAVTVQTSSLQALEQFRANPREFDLVITDNTMPHMTGLELVEKIVAIRHDLPAIMVSGTGDALPRDELRARGVRMILPKPYQIDDLKALVLEILANDASPGQ